MPQMPGVAPRELTAEDLKDPNLKNLNDYLRELATMVNVLAGMHGTIPITTDIDMQGHSIKNVKNIAGT